MLCAMSGTRFAALLTPILGDVSHSAPANDVRSAAPPAQTLGADGGRNGLWVARSSSARMWMILGGLRRMSVT